jgi:glycosyltransferase involved in cell wall biosynthesis
MPRLMVACEYPTLNGGERSFLATLDGVRDAGFEICVACPPTGRLAETLADRRVPVVPFSLRDSLGQRPPLKDLRAKLESVMTRQRPDLFHANSLSMSRLAGPVVEEIVVPSIGHLRDIVRLSGAVIADLNRHTRLLAVSRATRDFHVNAGVDASKTHVLHNGVCLREFRPREPNGFLHRELGLPGDARLIAGIGQVGVRKGFDLVLRTLRQVISHLPQVHCLIIGQRHSEKAEAVDFETLLHRTAREPPLAGRVHFLGWRSDIAAILNELTLLVHAARQEPFGRVLLEAAAAGVPVVATDVGGTREVFGQDSTEAPIRQPAALLVPGDDVDALTGAILQILKSPDLAGRLAVAGRNRASQSLDIRQSTEHLLRHYREVLEERVGNQKPRRQKPGF